MLLTTIIGQDAICTCFDSLVCECLVETGAIDRIKAAGVNLRAEQDLLALHATINDLLQQAPALGLEQPKFEARVASRTAKFGSLLPKWVQGGELSAEQRLDILAGVERVLVASGLIPKLSALEAIVP